MMKIEQLNDDYAIEIANHWKYPDPYSFYNMTADPEAFIRLIMSYIKNNYQVSTIFLSVIDFNIRAQKVYEKKDYKKTRELLQETNGSTYCFIEMKFEL